MTLEQTKEEFYKRFVEEGSFKVQGDCNEVWQFIEELIEQEKE